MKINNEMKLILDRECFDDECPDFYSKYTESGIRVCIEFGPDYIHPSVDVTSCEPWIESDNDLLVIAQAWKYIQNIARQLKELK